MKGWHGEPVRHALASKGVKTVSSSNGQYDSNDAPPKDIFVDWDNIEEEIDKGNPIESDYYEALDITYPKKKIINLFWWCSANDEWEWFDFKTAKEVFRNEILWWLFQEVSFLSVWGDKKAHSKIDEKGIDWVFDVETYWATPPTDMFSDEPIVSHEEWEEGEKITKFQPAIKEYVDLYKELGSHDFDKSPIEENIALIDKVINIEHNHGTALLFRTKIPEIRDEFESRYL